MYEELAGQNEMQDQMLYVYAQRREPEATDKLLQIARSEKNPELKKKAVFWLSQRKEFIELVAKQDGRVTELAARRTSVAPAEEPAEAPLVEAVLEQ